MTAAEVVVIGKKKGLSMELDPTVFEAPIKPHLFQAEVRRQMARRRAGTHSTKNRSAVSGGGAKPYRQKGTGRARQGTIRAPQWAGGGVVFGPVPREYEHSLPKKARRAALRGAISLRRREKDLLLVDGLSLDGYKTRRMAEILTGLGLGENSVLIVLAQADPHVEVSARNLPGVTVIRAGGLNVYDVLRHQKLVITRDAVAALEERLGLRRPAQEATQ